MIITLTANPSLDVVMVVSEPRLHALNRAERTYTEPSGKGLNVSRALAALGLRSTAVAPLGGSFGTCIREALRKAAFKLEPVPIAGETRVNTKILGGPEHALTEFNSPGPEMSKAEWSSLEDTVAKLASPGDAVTLSGSLPPTVPASAYADLVVRLRRAGAFVVLDADGAALREALASTPDAIKPNRREASELVGRPIVTFGDAVTAAEELRATGPDLVVLTLDRLGALIANPGRTIFAVPPTTRQQNVTGAGDAVVAGLLASQQASRSPAGLARLCVATGTARASAPYGAFGDAATVQAFEQAVDVFELEPADWPTWSNHALDELTPHDIRRAAGQGSDRTRKGRHP